MRYTASVLKEQEMPRPVDHNQRKREIVYALWKLVSVHGLEGASMRNVAVAAHMSTGQLQHYFKTRDDLLEYAITLLSEQAQKRIEAKLAALPAGPSPESVLRECLYDVLGLDPESQLTILVHIAFFAHIITNPRVSEVVHQENKTLYAFTAELIRSAQAAGASPSELDADAEAYIVWALAVSLGMDVAIGEITAKEAVARLDYYIRKIFI